MARCRPAPKGWRGFGSLVLQLRDGYSASVAAVARRR